MHVYFPSFFLFFLLGYSLTYNLDLEVGVGLWSRSRILTVVPYLQRITEVQNVLKDELKDIRSALYHTTRQIISCTKFTDDNAAALSESTQTSANGFRSHPYCSAAPSIVTQMKLLSNELAFGIWNQISPRSYQKYSEIYPVPSIVVALILLHSTIYRHSSEIII